MSSSSDALIEETLAEYENKSLSELQTSISKIDTEIHNNVSTHHNDLLAQSTNVELMDDVIVKTLTRTRSSLNNVQKLHSNVDHLYTALESSVRKLENLYQVRRQLATFEKVLKYNELIDDVKNLGNVATHVTSIEALCASSNLDQVKPYREKASSLFQNIEKQTENMLLQGLNSKSYNQVASSLQTLTNMKILHSKVHKITCETEKSIEKDLKQCLKLITSIESSNRQSSLGTGPGSNQPPGRAFNFKPNEQQTKQIWANLEALTVKIVSHIGKIKYLQHVMKTAKDLNSNYYFDSLADEKVWERFWDNFVEMFMQNLGTCQVDFVRKLFEDKFPRLLGILNGLSSQLEDCTDLTIRVSISPRLRGVILNYEKAFLSKSLNKLFEFVNRIFANSACPKQAEVDSLVRLVDEELEVDDAILRKLLNRNVSKTVQLFCHRTEQLVSNEGTATQVIGTFTEAQQSNVLLVNTLEYFKTKMKAENSEPLSVLMNSILSPLFQAIGDALEAIILTLHQENFKRTARTTDYSLYMGELSTFAGRAAKEYLSSFAPTKILSNLSNQLCLRTIKSLVTNITLLNNMSDTVKKQLVVDLSHIEVALAPICPVQQDTLRFLRGFKKLLEMKPEEMRTSTLIGNVIPYSLVIHLLVMQTNGQVRAPHMINSWSVSKYLRWLDEQGENEKISLLRASLENYVQSVTSKGQIEFHPNYPIIMEFLRKSCLE